MLKRFLLLFLSLLLIALPAFACEHIDSGEVADDELEEVNKIPPQEGVDGSVDLACPICGEIVEQVILPALPVPAEHPASFDEEAQTAPAQVAQPVAPPEPDPEPEP